MGNFNLFFYLVLDNIAGILKIERTKKILEKLCIIQSLVTPACFAMLAINDSLVNEILVFKDYTNIFEEFMFFTFYLKPMSDTHLKNIIFEYLTSKIELEYEGGGRKKEELLAEDMANLVSFYDHFFMIVNTKIKTYTHNINEYYYIFSFMLPEYIAPVKNNPEKKEFYLKNLF